MNNQFKKMKTSTKIILAVVAVIVVIGVSVYFYKKSKKAGAPKAESLSKEAFEASMKLASNNTKIEDAVMA